MEKPIFLQEVQFLLELKEENHSFIYFFADTLKNNIKKATKNICTLKKEFRYDAKNFYIMVNCMVEKDNNIILNTIFDTLKQCNHSLLENYSLFKKCFLDIFVWSKTATNNFQIDFDTPILKILGNIGVKLNFINYEYDPN